MSNISVVDLIKCLGAWDMAQSVSPLCVANTDSGGLRRPNFRMWPSSAQHDMLKNALSTPKSRDECSVLSILSITEHN